MNPELMIKMKEIAEVHFKAMAKEMIVEIVPVALEQLAMKSENKIDDAMVALLKEPLKQGMLEVLEQVKF